MHIYSIRISHPSHCLSPVPFLLFSMLSICLILHVTVPLIVVNSTSLKRGRGFTAAVEEKMTDEQAFILSASVLFFPDLVAGNKEVETSFLN